MAEKSKIRFGVIGANHGHIYSQVDILVQAGAEFGGYFIAEDELAAAFANAFPGVERVGERERLLDDPIDRAYRLRGGPG